jgi:hypothetical protein
VLALIEIEGTRIKDVNTWRNSVILCRDEIRENTVSCLRLIMRTAPYGCYLEDFFVLLR